MIDTLKKRIQQLISAYEQERSERIELQAKLDESEIRNEAYRKQIQS